MQQRALKEDRGALQTCSKAQGTLQQSLSRSSRAGKAAQRSVGGEGLRALGEKLAAALGKLLPPHPLGLHRVWGTGVLP